MPNTVSTLSPIDPLLQRTEDAQDAAQHRGDGQGRQGQLQRGREELEQDVLDGHAAGNGIAEITVEQFPSQRT